MSDINIHLHKSGTKTAELICNWCGEPHAVEPEYREEILVRGAEKLAEMAIEDIKPEQTWTCGRCMLALNNLPPSYLQTDCHDHEVPLKRKF